jgi:hypothetical protein
LAWKDAVAQKTGHFVPDLTKGQVGQLGHFGKKCPPGKTIEVIEFTVANWSYFTGNVKSSAGLKAAPSQPNVGFLLTHADVAISLTLSQKPTKAHEAPKSVDKPMQLTAPEPEPTPAKMSWEELWADPDEVE